MKRTNKITALILALALAVFAFVSCGGDGDSEGSITLVLGLETPVEYEVDLSKLKVDNGLFSVLDYLVAEEKLTYEKNGTMISSVGELKPDASKGEYIFIFTSVEADFDVSEWGSTVEYKGMTLTSSGVGAGDMTVTDGAVIYIGTIVYG